MRSNPQSLRLLPLAALALLLAACEPEGDTGAADEPAAGELETDEQRILYALGHVLGENVAHAELSEDELAYVLRGVTDAGLGRESEVALEEYGPQLQAFMQERIEAAAERELADAEAFLDQQAAEDDAERTDSGIVIQTLTEGTGEQPDADSVVEVHYEGTLRDGSVFDSSIERGEPATFPLGDVIPCWTEALQHMRVGGEARITCPPDLAYGAQGTPGIPGNAALVFEVELLDIIPDEEPAAEDE